MLYEVITRMLQLGLIQQIEEIGMVFVLVGGPHQVVKRPVALHRGIVAGRDGLGAKLRAGVVEKGAELDLPVAQHIGIGGASRAVLVEEMGEYLVPVLAGEVDRVQGDSYNFV